MRVAVDTNILVYAHGIGDEGRVTRADALIPALRNRLVVPMQVVGELFNVLTRKARLDKALVLKSIELIAEAGQIAAASPQTLSRAIHLSIDHGFQIWDALILQTALDEQCRILLSEDMQHGFYWAGITVLNPFRDPEHPLLVDALSRGA